MVHLFPPTSKGGIPSSRNGRGTKRRTPVDTPNHSTPSHWHRHRPFNMIDGPTGPAVTYSSPLGDSGSGFTVPGR
eukprot:541660-Rhodomonas_salina.1